MPTRHSAPRAALLVAPLLFVAIALAGCSSGEAPEVPVDAGGTADPVLVEGRDVWSSQCARCHGDSGDGGSGPQLSDGHAAEEYPDIDDMTAVIREGKSAMPSFGGALTDEQIDAVARYVREVL